MILSLLMIAVLCCTMDSEEQTFRFLKLKPSAYVENIIYSDKAVNNLAIVIKNGYGSMKIACIPFTRKEYEEYVCSKSHMKRDLPPTESVVLRLGDRKLITRKRVIDQEGCYIACDDYFGGIALSVHYFGDCDVSKGLEPILMCMKYNVSSNVVKEARDHFVHVMNSIQRMNLPVYNNAFHLRRQYSFVGLGSRTTFDVRTETRSTTIYDFYNKFFLRLGWSPCSTESQGTWQDDKLFYTWMDRSGEKLARLVILSRANNEPEGQVTQTVYLDVIPYEIMEW